MIKEYVQINKK